MVTGEAIVLGAAALAEVKAYLRIEGAGELAVCQDFTGQVLLVRGFGHTVPAARAWQRRVARPCLYGRRARPLAFRAHRVRVVEADGFAAPREVRVTINVNSPGAAAPEALTRSSRQIARAVRSAMLAGD